MDLKVATENRIDRLRTKYREDVPKISIQRAEYYTESWRETAGRGLANSVRVAMAMKNVYEKMTHYVDPDDHIAGYWTEDFLGIPIDIERGVFNKVLETELDKKDILNFRIKSFAGALSYMMQKGAVLDFAHNMKISRSMGPSPINLTPETMMERKINRFDISAADKKALKNELLPYWRGRTVVDKVEKGILKSELLSSDMKDFARGMPANTSRQTIMISTCSTIGAYQGHVIANYENVLEKGLLAMLSEVAERAKDETLTIEQKDALESMRIAIEGVMVFATRLADKLEETLAAETDPSRRAVLSKMVDDCRTVPFQPAATFRQAVQSAWTMKTAIELAHPVNLHCFGRMDQALISYYEKDIAEKRITRSEACELLEELLLKIMSQNIRPETNILSNFYHRYLGSSPVTIGGLKPDGTDGANELTYLFMEASKRSKAVTNVSLRVHSSSSDELYFAAAEAICDGDSNISIFNDDINIKAMEKRGFKEADAKNYAVMGCVEMLCPGKTGSMSANALLLNRLLDITLRNGDSQTLLGKIKNVGLKTGNVSSFKTFDALLDAFMKQASRQIELIAAASDEKDRVYEQHLPAPYISAFMDGCLESAKDITQGGAEYDLTGVSFINSIANLVDSLYVIKKLVYEQKAFSMGDLMKAIDNNFNGYEDILKKIRSLEGKWGNGNDECDQLAREVTKRLFEETYKYESPRGGPYVPYVISMITHTVDGRISIATPDGRRAAMPYAASCNPYNVEKSGVTGAMKSVAAIDFEDVLGCAVNMKFHPSAIGTENETRKKWADLIRTYFKIGGAQLQPTVASAKMLREAKKNPQEYRDLIIKVGGYSTYFTDLGIEIQNEIIERTEHCSIS